MWRLIRFILFAIALSLPPLTCEGSNILFFHLLATSSHRTSIWPLAEKLADRGHNVTYIFPMKEKRIGSHPRIKEVTPSSMLPILKGFIGDFDINVRLNHSTIQWNMQLFSKATELCHAFYDSPGIANWLSKADTNYDLVLTDGVLGECGYGLVHKFRSKHIVFYPVSLLPYTWDAFGIVPSVGIPEGFFHVKPQELLTSLYGRVLTTLSVFIWRLGLLHYVHNVEPILKSKLKSTAVDILETERNVDLVLVNSHFIEDYAMALPPMIQSYSGLWCSKDKLKEIKPLPKDLVDFVEKGEEGFIFVSFGSAVVASSMPGSLRDQFFAAFEAFPKVRFLWRWPGDNVSDDIPRNVLLHKWFPQQDLLAHPNVTAFITQGGRPSVQEALCHGVPMIAIPIFAEQDYNADRLEYIGASISIDIDIFSAEMLVKAIKSTIYADIYKKRMTAFSKMFRDRPLDPLDNAVYWTEYVLRHNTSHLKPLLAMNLHWYQRRILDVYSLMAVIIIFILVANYKLAQLCVGVCYNLNKWKIKKD